MEKLQNFAKEASVTNHIYISVTGFSGIGKSSLCTQFLATLSQTAYCLDLDGSDWQTLKRNLFTKHHITIPVKQSELLTRFPDKQLVVIYIDNLFGSFTPTSKLASLEDNKIHFLSETDIRKVRNALLINDSMEATNSTNFAVASPDPENEPLIGRNKEIIITAENHDEDKTNVFSFLETFSKVLKTLQKKLVVVVSRVENREDNLTTHFEKLHLEELSPNDAELLVKTLFGIEDVDQISNLVSRYGGFPQTIKQAAAFYSSAVNYSGDTIPQFLNTNKFENMEKICHQKLTCLPITQTILFFPGREVIPMSNIYQALDNVAILMLAMLSFFPSRDISTEICTLLMTKLLLQFPTPGPSTRTRDTIVQEIITSRSMLQSYNLLEMSETGSPHILSIHQTYQARTLSSITPFHEPFSLKILAAVQELIENNENDSQVITERKSKDDLIRVADTVWKNSKDFCNAHQFLTIPRFLDDKSSEVYSSSRFTFLESVVQGVINTNFGNINRAEFNCLASRYIYTNLYLYMNYTSGIRDILRIREHFADFNIDTKLNNLHYTGKIYFLFNLFVFLVMSFLIASPFTMWWYSNRPYFELWWYHVYGIAVLVVLSVFVPLFQIHMLLIYSKAWARGIAQFSAIAIYLVLYGIFKFAEGFSFGWKFSEAHVSNIMIGITEHDLPLCTFISFCVIGSVTLCYVHGIRVSFSIIRANFQYRNESSGVSRSRALVNVVWQSLPELLHFLLSTVVFASVSFRFIVWIWANGVLEKHVSMGIVFVISCGVFLTYNFFLVWLYKMMIIASLWVSSKVSK